jgi:YHS domain-containing protein
MGSLLAYLFDVLASVLLARFLGRTLQRFGSQPRVRSRSGPARPGQQAAQGPGTVIRGETARDPVCGMFVSTELSHRLSEGGRTLHFCSVECRDRYRREERDKQQAKPA